jgi:hypothetical protein
VRSRNTLSRGLLVIAAIGLIAACGTQDSPPVEPVATVLRLVDWAGDPAADDLQLDRLFEMEDDGGFRAALLDAIDQIPDGEPEVRELVRFEDLDRAVVDLTFAMPEGGEVDWSVHVERVGETDWRVVGFHGPGVSWPPRRSPRHEGLSTLPEG